MKCEALTGKRLANPELGIPDRHTGGFPYRKTAKLSRAILPTFGDRIVTRFSQQSGGTVAAATPQRVEKAASPPDLCASGGRLCISLRRSRPPFSSLPFGFSSVQGGGNNDDRAARWSQGSQSDGYTYSPVTLQCGITAEGVA